MCSHAAAQLFENCECSFPLKKDAARSGHAPSREDSVTSVPTVANMWMRPAGELKIAVGLASRTGLRPDNQDFVAAYQATPAERITHGAVAALADGVGGANGGRIAAELTCRSFIDAYYSLPATLGVAIAADKALRGVNRWLNGMASADPAMEGAATTFSAVVLRDRFVHVLHV